MFRLAQMAKNKLKIQNPKALLAEMYVLVMGEEGEDEDVSFFSQIICCIFDSSLPSVWCNFLR